jgi:hypothetical protein
MAWTYSGNPASSDRDKARFLIGDVVQTPHSITDEEMQYLISEAPEPKAEMAAAEAADLWADRFAGLSASSKSVGDLSIAQDYAGASDRLHKLAARLRTRRIGGMAPLIFDTRASVFAVGQDDNPSSGSADYARWF